MVTVERHVTSSFHDPASNVEVCHHLCFKYLLRFLKVPLHAMLLCFVRPCGSLLFDPGTWIKVRGDEGGVRSLCAVIHFFLEATVVHGFLTKLLTVVTSKSFTLQTICRTNLVCFGQLLNCLSAVIDSHFDDVISTSVSILDWFGAQDLQSMMWPVAEDCQLSIAFTV